MNIKSCIQVIDSKEQFMPTMELWLKEHGLKHCGFDYSVVSVLGCPNSGKSTLLNKLFGTTFEEGKGLWLSRDKHYNTILIDTEGTDFSDRKEYRLTFEHRVTFFSLAISDVVIVNICYYDLNSFTVLYYNLLNTVLVAYLKLFQQQEDIKKSTLWFVIQDHNESQTSIKELNEMIQKDIRGFWNCTIKPEHLRDSSADDFFVFRTVGLPGRFSDFELLAAKYDELKKMWIKDLKPQSYSRQIPAEGFAGYCKSVWETIRKSAELDIPLQEKMLATFKCEELKNAAMAEVLLTIPIYLERARNATLSTEIEWANTLVKKAVEVYDSLASVYQTSIYVEKRNVLIFQLQLELQKVFDASLSDLRHRIATEATSFLDCLNRWESQTVEKFDGLVISTTMLHKGGQLAATIEVKFESDFTFKPKSLESEDLQTANREKQQIALVKVAVNLASDRLGDFAEYLTAKNLSVENFWNRITEAFSSAKKEVMESLRQPWLGIRLGKNSDADNWDGFVSTEVLRKLRHKLEQLCGWLQKHIYKRFQLFFNQDNEGATRQWQHLTSKEIKEIYENAKNEGFVIMTIMESVNLNLDEFFKEHQSLKEEILSPLLPLAKKEEAAAEAEGQMKREFEAAERAREERARAEKEREEKEIAIREAMQAAEALREAVKRQKAEERERLATIKQKETEERERLATMKQKEAEERERLATMKQKEAEERERLATTKQLAAEERERMANMKLIVAMQRESLATTKQKTAEEGERMATMKQIAAEQRESLATTKQKAAEERERLATRAKREIGGSSFQTSGSSFQTSSSSRLYEKAV